MHGGGASASNRRGRGKKRRGGNEEVALQITSMADIFTIILVFLLKSYAVSATNVNVGKDVHLPTAQGSQDLVEAMKVEISETAINLEGQPVVTLKAYQAENGEVTADGISKSLVKALTKEREKQRALASATGPEASTPEADKARREMNSKLLIIADKKVPYKLLKVVLASASVQDYTDFKLVTVQAD